MKEKKIKLGKYEKIIAVTPEYCSGPGWSNSVVWVHIVDFASKTYRLEDIQPEERTNELSILFRIGADVHDALMNAVNRYVTVEKEKQDAV